MLVERVDEPFEESGQYFPFVGFVGVHDGGEGLDALGLSGRVTFAPRFGDGHHHHASIGFRVEALGELVSFETLHGTSGGGRIDAQGVGEIAHAPRVLLHEQIECVHLTLLERIVADAEEVFDESAHRRTASDLSPGTTDSHRHFAMRRVLAVESSRLIHWLGGRHRVCRVQAVEPPLHALNVLATQSTMIASDLRHVELFTARGLVTLLWHEVPRGVPAQRAAIVACCGAMGGLLGPSGGLYQQLGERWARRGVPVVRVDYRRPNDLDACCLDVAAAVQLVADAGAERIVVMGHSFGGAVAVRVGVVMDEVSGVVTFATQSAGCEVAAGLRGRPLLLFHGDADEILPMQSSEVVAAMAGRGDVVVCEGDGHLLSFSGDAMLARLDAWLPDVLGLPG